MSEFRLALVGAAFAAVLAGADVAVALSIAHGLTALFARLVLP